MTERCSEIDKYPPAVIKVGTQQPHGMCSQQLVFFSPHFVFSSFPSWTGSCLEQWGFSGSFSSCSGRTSHTAGETRWPHFYFTEKIRIVCWFCKETYETQLGRKMGRFVCAAVTTPMFSLVHRSSWSSSSSGRSSFLSSSSLFVSHTLLTSNANVSNIM